MPLSTSQVQAKDRTPQMDRSRKRIATNRGMCWGGGGGGGERNANYTLMIIVWVGGVWGRDQHVCVCTFTLRVGGVGGGKGTLSGWNCLTATTYPHTRPIIP